MTIPTVASLRRDRRRLDRRRQGADRIITLMQRGATLQLSYENGRGFWRLSDGRLGSCLVARGRGDRDRGPKRAFDTGGSAPGFRGFAVIAELTKEMAQHSAIEAVLRILLQESATVAIDTLLLSNSAATSAAPAGLLNGLTTLTPSAATTVEDRMAADLGGLAAAIPGAIVAVYVMPLAERLVCEALATSELLQRVIVSPVMPAKRIVAIDAGAFASLTGDTAEFDVNEVAAIHEEDTTPLPISTVGTPNVVAAPVRSLWQTGSIGVRLFASLSWAMRLTGRVAFVDAVTW